MEAVGLALGAIGLAGLFSSCLELIKRAESYRSVQDDSEILQSFSIQKWLFLRWGQHVGLAQADEADSAPSTSYHEALKEAEVAAAVTNVLKITNEIFQKGFQPLERLRSGGNEAQPLLQDDSPAAAALSRSMSKVQWNSFTKAMVKEQTEIFQELVQRLYALVPTDPDADLTTARGLNRPDQQSKDGGRESIVKHQQAIARLEDKTQSMPLSFPQPLPH